MTIPTEPIGSIPRPVPLIRAVAESGAAAQYIPPEQLGTTDAEEAQARLAAIVESSQDAIISKTLDSRILTWNAGAEQLFGWTAAEAIGQPITFLIPPDRQTEEQMIMDKLCRGERIEHYETVRIRKDGRPLDIALTISPIRDRTGRIIGASKIARDVTAQRAMATENARLLATLQEADTRKDEFLAMLAHELRNPLAPIRNAAQIFRRKGPPVPELQWATDVIDRQVRQMSRLVDDLLDVSRITRGKIDLRRERIDLSAVVSSAVDASRPLIEKWGHELRVSVPTDPIELEADPTRLAQVLQNLLHNAAKYTDQGGHIWLSVEREDATAVIRVKDTGVGIPAQMLPRVFDMFTQLDCPRERSEGGLGIGLTLVQRLVEMHGGSVEARSAGAGAGSEFVVRLPIVGPVRHATGDDRDRSMGRPAIAGRRILVVDDNHDAADSLAMLLHLMGHDVHTAYDGLEAIGAVAEFRPELLLLDLGLPKLNGHEVAKRIRQNDGARDLLIVALTGWGQKDDHRRSKEAGFDVHMTKPVDVVALQTLLARLPAASATTPTFPSASS